MQIVLACLLVAHLTGTLSTPVETVSEQKKIPIVEQQKTEEVKPVADQPHVDTIQKDQDVGVKVLPGVDVRGKDDIPQVPVQAGEVPKDIAAEQAANPVERSGTGDLETANTFWGGKKVQ